MATLYRFSRADATSKSKFARSHTSLSLNKSKHTIEVPDAPLKPIKSAKMNSLMSRWKSRAVVRNLLPDLCDPHNPEYWEAVDEVQDLLKRK